MAVVDWIETRRVSVDEVGGDECSAGVQLNQLTAFIGEDISSVQQSENQSFLAHYDSWITTPGLFVVLTIEFGQRYRVVKQWSRRRYVYFAGRILKRQDLLLVIRGQCQCQIDS